MFRRPDEIAPWAAGYVGIEFRDRGRDRDGADCWGLVRLVQAERFGVLLPSLSGEYSGVDDRKGLLRQVLHQRDELGWWGTVSRDSARPGDVPLFLIGGALWHVGVMVGPERMLHVLEGTAACIESPFGRLWSSRLTGLYRYTGPVRLTGWPRPLSGPRIDAEVPAGLTLSEMLSVAGVQVTPCLRLFVGDREVPAEAWPHVRPKAGRVVRLTAVPAGGGGGGKDPGRVILSLAVVAAAAFIPGPQVLALTGTAAAVTSAAIGIGGMLLINALLPPPKPKISDGLGRFDSPTITGARNEARPLGVVPEVLGEHRIAPLYGALPYTEIAGDDQYLRCLFVPGRGPLEISDLKIGDTPIEEYEGVEVEIREGRPGDAPISLYPGVVLEESLSTLIEQVSEWIVRTSDTDADELSIDLTFPQGLVEFSRSGARSNRTVVLEVEYSPAGAEQWTRVNGPSPSDARGLDFLFRTPEVLLGGASIVHSGRVAWGLGFPDAKPAYLPPTPFSWFAGGYVYAETAGEYAFGIDGSDACDLKIDGRVVASWYGSHGTAGAPDFTAHQGAISLTRGWHRFQLRVEARSTSGAAAAGWKRPGDGAFSVIPAGSFSRRADGSLPGTLFAGWYRTDAYAAAVSVTESRPEQLRRNLSWAVPEGQYDVRIRRLTPDNTEERVLDDVYWTALRTIRSQDPVALDRVAKIAVRIKATDQLNGALDQLNCVCRSIVPDWNATLGQWVERSTSNPASLYRWVLQGGASRPVADERMDLSEIQAWHAGCEDKGLRFDGVLDTEGTVYDRLNEIAAAGRATFGMKDGLFSVVRDRSQTTPIQHFTPRNTTPEFSARKAFPDLPHALRVRFLNREIGYQPDERIILDDGYQLDASVLGLAGLTGPRDAFGNAAPTLPPATKFETLEQFGITTPDGAFKAGRYLIAVARLRPEVYEIGMDLEHLACSRGDMVLFTHDVVQFGLASGRVSALITDSGDNLHGVALDVRVTMDAGKQYRIRVRLDTGAPFFRDVNTVEGEQTEVRWAHPVSPSEPRPKVGDLWMFGEVNLATRRVTVRNIVLGSDLSAKVELVDHAPGVHDADVGPIPIFQSKISKPPNWNNGPEGPVIESIRSDDFVMIRDPDGSLRDRMLITLKRPSTRRPPATHAQVMIRPKPVPPATPAGPWQHLTLPIENRQIGVLDVQAGITYEIRIRTITALGLASAWITAEHTVVGKSLPPPDVEVFDVLRLGDGTRRYTWDLGEIPRDIAGVRIRYGAGAGLRWDQLSPLHSGVLEGASPTELNVPPAGTWTFGIVMVDTSENESRNPLLITRTLGAARQENVAVSVDCRADNWPGILTDCYVSNDDSLVARGRETWATLASIYNVYRWEQWWRWTIDPVTPIRYTHPIIDAGFILECEPAAYALADGSVTAEVNYSDDRVVWSGWQRLEDLAGTSVRGRHFQFRVRVDAASAGAIPVLHELVLMLRARMIEEIIEDLDTAGIGAPLRIGTGDFRLPLPADQFAAVRGTSLSFNGTGAGWTWEVVDKLTDPGPRVRIYNELDEADDAVIDAVVRGIAKVGDGSLPEPPPVGEPGQWDFSSAENSDHALLVWDA